MERLRIAVTGASGFVGANLVNSLKDRHEVFALSRSSNNWRLDGFDTERVDITDRERTISIIRGLKLDVIIHCAVYGGYHFETDTRQIIDTNIIGTMNVIDACDNTTFFINTGSSSEYGIRDSPMKESDLIRPNTDYAMTKALITNLLVSKGIYSTTLRLFSVYGYYEERHRLIPTVLYSMIRGTDLVLSNRHNVRDFIFVEDVVRAYNAVIAKRDKLEMGEIFNVGTGKQTSVEDVVKITKAKVRWNSEVRTPEPERVWQADISKIKSELGWEPEYDLRTGLDKTKRWMEENIEFYEEEKNDKRGKFGSNSKRTEN